MAQEWFCLLAFFNMAALSQTASIRQNKTMTDGKLIVTGDYNEIVITNYLTKETVPSEIHEKLDSLREGDEALHKKVKELEGRISTLGEIRGKLSLMNKTIVELNKKIEKINKPARFRTVLPSISQVNKTLEGSEVLLIQNHNQVVVSGDGKIAAGLSETRKKLDSLNKLTLELDRKVQALEQKVTQMTDSDYGLRFPKVGTSDYVIIRGMPSLKAVTVCFWMMTADQRSDAVPFSYAAHSNANEILFINHHNFRLAIANEERTTSVSANDGKWHHICATWENTAGSWKFYKDGVMKASGRSLKAGHVIQGGGVLTLGQDQDVVGGNFQAIQSFVGELTGVNIWNHVTNSEEIFRMSQSCLSGEGNVFKWSDFKAHVQGGVQVIAQPSCRV